MMVRVSSRSGEIFRAPGYRQIADLVTLLVAAGATVGTYAIEVGNTFAFSSISLNLHALEQRKHFSFSFHYLTF